MGQITSETYSLDKLLPVLIDDTSGETNLAKADVLVHLLRVFGIKGAPSTAHFEKQDAKGPEVDEFRVTMLVEENFWCQVFGRPTESVGQLVGSEVRL